MVVQELLEFEQIAVFGVHPMLFSEGLGCETSWDIACIVLLTGMAEAWKRAICGLKCEPGSHW